MNKFILPMLVAGVVVFSSATAQQKIGYVNSTKIFEELPEAKDAQKKLEALTKPVQDEIEKREKMIKDKYDEYQKKSSLMNETAKKAAEQELIDLQEKYRQYRADKSDEIAKQREKLFTPIKEKALKAVEKVAKDLKYAFVFDQNETISVLLYGEPASDLTYKVIDRLKTGK